MNDPDLSPDVSPEFRPTQNVPVDPLLLIAAHAYRDAVRDHSGAEATVQLEAGLAAAVHGVLLGLGREIPDHFGPNPEWTYRGWLHQHADAIAKLYPSVVSKFGDHDVNGHMVR
jgi:hypothetical protein